MTSVWARPLAMLFGLAIAFGSATASAHEFWVEPSTFGLERGGPVGIRLCVGDGFEGWSLARNAQRIEKFVAAGPAGEQPIVGLDGSDPAGFARLTAPGDYVITYRSNRAFTELPAAKFDEYVKQKGLEKIVALRKWRGASRKTVREAYSRHSKALIRVGDAEGSVIDRPMGLRLELVAEPDLSRAPDGELRSFRLLHDGKPLAGALVSATRPGTTDGDLQVRTGADGRASFRLREPGMWRVAAVHLIEPPRDVAADWESLWASLTFELPSEPSNAARDTGAARKTACQNRIATAAMQARS
jgi:uncharacterized GH25 family protein